jgi:hypothetical protein
MRRSYCGVGEALLRDNVGESKAAILKSEPMAVIVFIAT